MSKSWSIRWWDGIALFIALLIALFVVYYALHKSDANGIAIEATIVTIRVPAPLPEIVNSLQVGDHLVNRKNESVAVINSITSVNEQHQLPSTLSVFSKHDLLLTLSVSGNLRLKRDLLGFPLEPAPLKIGVWCLLTTNKVDLSGMIVEIDPQTSLKE